MKYLFAYLAAAAAFWLLDFAWLMLLMRNFYKAELGDLLLESPRIVPAVVFYLGYVVAIVIFAVVPAGNSSSWPNALVLGALFGLFAYGTYDLTNLATLKGWSWKVSALDTAWGAFATGVSATAGYFAFKAAS